ncbi:MAG: glycerol-3-phosphate dehydrogenase/oxidase [Cyclobacteriaceae bacterium]
MRRDEMIDAIAKRKEPWDILVIGGGATGLGIAVDAASRGYSTLLLEQHDFAKGTSSRSTKLVHGGVRYLQQGDISLVMEALKERGLMIKNAPHLVKNQPFIIPNYDWWDGPFYQIGLKVYDWMSGKLGIGSSKKLSKEETVKYIPTIDQTRLTGGVKYYDGQFDDARMAISLALTAVDYGATLVNYFAVTGISKNDEIVSGVSATDSETGINYDIPAKVVINATGVFADKIKQLDEPDTPDMIQPSQGTHVVVDREFLPHEYAIMVPHTKDGRVMFAVPWHGKVVLGTTDTLVNTASLEPKPLSSEIDFILETAGNYLVKNPTRADIKSVFAGLRPLAKPEGDDQATKEVSRHHKILVSKSGLISIVGGKWTTYRKMAEDTVDQAMIIGGLDEQKAITENLLIHGYLNFDSNETDVYGADRKILDMLISNSPQLGDKLSPHLSITGAHVIWAVQNEMARTVEDVLARRTRSLLLDAQESINIAPAVAILMAREMNEDDKWVKHQVEHFQNLAAGYLVS